jgi:hypothetical protein
LHRREITWERIAAGRSDQEPEFRIHLPPARSLVRTGFAAASPTVGNVVVTLYPSGKIGAAGPRWLTSNLNHRLDETRTTRTARRTMCCRQPHAALTRRVAGTGNHRRTLEPVAGNCPGVSGGERSIASAMYGGHPTIRIRLDHRAQRRSTTGSDCYDAGKDGKRGALTATRDRCHTTAELRIIASALSMSEQLAFS